jgi:hypothetical protein
MPLSDTGEERKGFDALEGGQLLKLVLDFVFAVIPAHSEEHNGGPRTEQ